MPCSIVSLMVMLVGTTLEERPWTNLFGETWDSLEIPSRSQFASGPSGRSFTRLTASKINVLNCSMLKRRGVFKLLSNYIDFCRAFLNKRTQISIIPAKLEALEGKKCQSKPLKLALISGQSSFFRASLNTFAPEVRFVPLSDQTFRGQPRTATKARKALMKAAVVNEVTTCMKRVTKSDAIITQHF